jgi:hypothetical protein
MMRHEGDPVPSDETIGHVPPPAARGPGRRQEVREEPAKGEASQPNVALVYAARRPGVRRRWKHPTVLLAVATVVAAAWWWRKDIATAMKVAPTLPAQRQSLVFDPGPDRVAYEEDPAKAQALLALPDYPPD